MNMNVISDLSPVSKKILKTLLFEEVESTESGMTKYCAWSNADMKLSLVFDRMYYDCTITPHKKPFNKIDIIRVLRFLKNDKEYYKQELIDANLSYTLSADHYLILLSNNYVQLKQFCLAFDQETYDRYIRFEYSYDGI